ncbi:hypothetical protein GX411_04675 [Candidatus Fermentibacteria bacterium]|nr:hypothetical protein [Candidatus Fermentibacteria bacterium]
MEHRVLPATWKSKGSLARVIADMESGGWSVATFGEVFSGSILVMIRDGRLWTHEVVQLFWKMKDNVAQLIREREKDGWEVAAIGDCLGGTVMILKKVVGVSRDGQPASS